MELLTQFGAISSGLAVGGAFFAMGLKADGLISQRARSDLANYLLSSKLEEQVRAILLWPRVFAEFFDQIFGKKHLSWKCFFRSSIASYLAASICLFVLIVMSSQSGYMLAPPFSALSDFQHPADLKIALIYLGGVSIINLVPDYFSLLESRMVIKKIGEANSVLSQFAWIVFDVLATFVIIFLAFLFVDLLFVVLAGASIEDAWTSINPVSLFTDSVTSPIVTSSQETMLAPFIWTTFFTSVWIWLYFISQILTRTVAPLRQSVRALQYVLPIDAKPLQSVCTVLAITSCVMVWIILIPYEMVAGS